MYSKEYRDRVLFERAGIPEQGSEQWQALVWFTRESFDRAAAGDALRIVEFDFVGEVDVNDLPPKGIRQWNEANGTKLKPQDFICLEFRGVGVREVDDAVGV